MLELLARPGDDARDDVRVMPASPAVELVGRADDDGQQQQPEREAQQRAVHLYEEPREDAQHDDHEQEARAAPGMEAALGPDVLHRQGQALLVAEDGLVLRAVVGEETLHVLHPGDEAEVDEEDDDLQRAFEEAAQGIMPVHARDEPGDEGGQEEEKPHGQQHAQHGGYADDYLLRLLAAQLFLKPKVELRRLLLLILGQKAR